MLLPQRFFVDIIVTCVSHQTACVGVFYLCDYRPNHSLPSARICAVSTQKPAPNVPPFGTSSFDRTFGKLFFSIFHAAMPHISLFHESDSNALSSPKKSFLMSCKMIERCAKSPTPHCSNATIALEAETIYVFQQFGWVHWHPQNYFLFNLFDWPMTSRRFRQIINLYLLVLIIYNYILNNE